MDNIKKYKYISLTGMLTLVTLSVFLLPQQIRVGLLGENIGTINLVATFIISIILIKWTNKFNKGYLFFIVIYICYFIINYIYCQTSIKNFILTFCSFIAPAFLIGLEVSKNSFKKYFERFLKIFNFIIIVITVMGIVDLFLGNKLILNISSIMSNSLKNLIYTQQSLEVARLYSFMGHPLFNTQLYLMFFILNLAYESVFNKTIIKKFLIYLVPILGIAMTASKTGLILLLFSIIVFNNSRKKIINYIVIAFLLFVSFNLGIFNNTIERLLTETLTTGRAEYWDIYMSNPIYPIRLFKGYGNGFVFYYNTIVPWISAGFEYPIRLFSLEQGVIFTILIYISIFIYPIYTLLKQKSYKLLLMYIIIFFDVNTYNGIAIVGDYMIIFSMFIFIILNLSKIKNDGENNKY